MSSLLLEFFNYYTLHPCLFLGYLRCCYRMYQVIMVGDFVLKRNRKFANFAAFPTVFLTKQSSQVAFWSISVTVKANLRLF
jgi:hypothetical protein